jgi:hypothetical protein
LSASESKSIGDDAASVPPPRLSGNEEYSFAVIATGYSLSTRASSPVMRNWIVGGSMT